ncbi:integral membrane protein GPR155 [Anthonomus grandis grandis]|uniref:integral membrane protein GPR155 n=1 Tax=Anthonomus grandis grandis TaxID=2921223 RepID=UPI0021669081|nr:integral membrane protein GPR155 [Anthonomus grandis grandis]XP_050299820.1 integral membrane protein GPR155 [Anthonomus grandis grandis]
MEVMEPLQAPVGAAIENLYPALLQCFAIILSGYAAGRMNWISETESKGMNTFVGTFSLPALIFMSLAELDLSSVNWMFLVAILLAKSVVFFAVIVVTLLVGRPLNLGRAGIFAIFCTQSNDFAIGYPIVAALYKSTHPEYASYLYLVAPINLAILNPLAFVLMEIHKKRALQEDEEALLNQEVVSINSSECAHHRKRCKMVVTVMKNIFFNPIIFMTILGIAGNVIFKHQVPVYFAGILNGLGSAFSASSLFLLGLRMVGKIHKLTGATLVVPGILIMVKLIALPLITREVVNVLHSGYNSSETLDLSTYGFFYGTFPTAPGVFVFAGQYMIDIDLIANAMVACTFLSAPLMFISAKMITITNCDPSQYIKELDQFTLDVSVVGVIACIWILGIFTLTKKITKIPHKITACLVVSHFISCLGAILWNVLKQDQESRSYLQFSLFTIGVYSSRIWTAILAITLLFLQCRSLCFALKLQPLFFGFGWGLPVLLCAALLIFDKSSTLPFEKRNPNFAYGVSQAIVAVSLLVLCFIVTAGCLILHQRYRRRHNRYLDLSNEIATDFDPQINEDATGSCCSSGENSSKTSKCNGLPTIKEGGSEEVTSPVVDIEDLVGSGGFNSAVKRIKTKEKSTPQDLTNEAVDPGRSTCSTRYGCGGPHRESCRAVVGQYQQPIDNDLEPIEEDPESHDPQILRHTVLLILLLCSMFVGLSLSIWTLVLEQISGIYVELSFLDAILNFGQSLIVLIIFGLDVKEVTLPILKFWRKLWFGANTLILPAWDELSPETKQVCDQFATHHLRSCKSAIASEKRWRFQTYRNVFTGAQFIDWMIKVGLARDRIEAVNYGRHLVEGKIIKHINGVYHFYDRNLLYTFV